MIEDRITESDIDWVAEIADADEQAVHDYCERFAEEEACRFFGVPRSQWHL